MIPYSSTHEQLGHVWGEVCVVPGARSEIPFWDFSKGAWMGWGLPPLRDFFSCRSIPQDENFLFCFLWVPHVDDDALFEPIWMLARPLHRVGSPSFYHPLLPLFKANKILKNTKIIENQRENYTHLPWVLLKIHSPPLTFQNLHSPPLSFAQNTLTSPHISKPTLTTPEFCCL